MLDELPGPVSSQEVTNFLSSVSTCLPFPEQGLLEGCQLQFSQRVSSQVSTAAFLEGSQQTHLGSGAMQREHPSWASRTPNIATPQLGKRSEGGHHLLYG